MNTTTDNEHQQLLTVPEACDRLRISRATFYTLVRSGQLRTLTIGRARRIAVAVIDQFISAETSLPNEAKGSP